MDEARNDAPGRHREERRGVGPGRPPKGERPLIELVKEAIRNGCVNSQQIAKETGLRQPQPYLALLEKTGQIQKVRSVELGGVDSLGRRFKQHGWEWELVDSKGLTPDKMKNLRKLKVDNILTISFRSDGTSLAEALAGEEPSLFAARARKRAMATTSPNIAEFCNRWANKWEERNGS